MLLLTADMEKMLTLIYKKRKLFLFLQALCHFTTLAFVLALCLAAGVFIYKKEYVVLATLLVSVFVGFILVSVLRKLIDAPRPYELYTFYEKKPKNKKGSSFPSRHVYSAFAIATLCLAVGFPLAILLFSLAIAMCVCRVLLGIHFIRDVAAGALIGIVAGGIGLLLI